MSKPNLLLCFDAFGTLFRPKRPVYQQYGEVARRFGITIHDDEQIHASFRKAFNDESKRNPNYGKATGLGATKWWTNVIQGTFTPMLPRGETLPKDLAPALLCRFSSSEGYTTEPNLLTAIKSLKQPSSRSRFDKIVVGVITNSDDRVPNVLSSFGLDVSDFRYGTSTKPSEIDHDVDFHCISYDVGVEKPSQAIFDAATFMLAQILAVRYGSIATQPTTDLESWVKAYVGDEYEKDVLGSLSAGWSPFLLGAEQASGNVSNLEDCRETTIKELFERHDAVRVDSIQNLVTWLLLR